MKSPVLYFVLPCYNEHECLMQTFGELNKKYKKLLSDKRVDTKSRIVFVDDGSEDATWDLIDELTQRNPQVVGIKLARNVGHQNALMAGLSYAAEHADYSISMDADMQDDLNVVEDFLQKAEEGYEVVYGVRTNRETDSSFKRGTAQIFYKIMRFLGVDLVYNAADCRLMSGRAMRELCNYHEVNLFLRGIVPLIGLKSTTVGYMRNKRAAGESKYPLKKMLSFAWDGVTSFSVKPIKLVLSLGFFVFFLSLIVTLYAIIRWRMGETVDGWTFTVCSIWVVAGIQMISIGLIGEYIGKIYAETKRRPRYFIEAIVGGDNGKNK